MPGHGSRSRYNHRSAPCRCDRCREANARYMRDKRNAEQAPAVKAKGWSEPPLWRAGAGP